MRSGQRNRRSGWPLTILVVAAATAGCGSDDPSAPIASQTAAPTGGNAPAPTTCRSADLSVTLGPSEGAAGTVYRALRFTNTGGGSCVLHGFPGVSYVGGDSGAQVGPAAEHDGPRGGPVTLAPKAVASATVGMVNVGNFEPSACHPSPVKGLRVYPPGETASVFVAATGTGCAGTPPGPQLRVRTVQPGPGER